MKRNKFSLSHYNLTTMKMGTLVPVGLVEVLPGDTFQHSTSMLVRCSPLVAPVMHPCHVRIHHWFVPNRIIWDNWENFITGGPDGLNASVFPTVNVAANLGVSSLLNYIGVPAAMANTAVVSALPLRAYALIFNEWYRDQDLTSPLAISTADGTDSTTNTTLQSVAWEKDYYTTARPFTQKGPTVTIPLTGSAPITGIGILPAAVAGATGTLNETGTNGVTYAQGNSFNTGNLFAKLQGTNPSAKPAIFADLSAVTAADINTLRQAFALQRFEEARARYGSRYTEYLRYLGIRSSDARLQRPEYLGGGKQTIQFSEVLQTGVTTGGAVAGVGNMAGHGISAIRSNRYRRFFEEHGYVITLMSIKPRTMYPQGIRKTLLRRTKTDFWQKELEHIGQQAIQNQEVYADQSAANQTATFGFQDRYDEYRRMESTVTGQFQTSSLNFWHMARIFGSAPTLNSSFVTANPTNRIFADQTGNDTMYVMCSHSIQARRMLAKMGTSFIY